jgi:hypothetical protein
LLQEDRTAEAILKRLSDTKNYPDDTLDPYLEFSEGGKLYYFTPGGFLYRRETRCGTTGLIIPMSNRL